MCIYCGTKHYRKIYESHYGPIPKDEVGCNNDIHHKDGNHSNNDPANLKAVSIQEHYDIHYARGDWAACLRLSGRMKLSSREVSDLASKSSLRRVANGTHNLLRRADGSSQSGDQVKAGTHHLLGGKIQRRLVSEGKHHLLGGEIQKKANKDRVEKGTHNFLGSAVNDKRVADGTHHWQDREKARERAQDRIAKGTHHFLGSEVTQKQLANGTHPSQKSWKCEYCGKEGKGAGVFTRFHGEKCKKKPT